MILGDLNILIIIFFILFFSFFININTSLHLILTAELIWITLYFIVVFNGFLIDDLNLISLSLFFLILSAVEFGFGLIIILYQHIYFKSIQNNIQIDNFLKFILKFKIKIFKNKLKF